MPVHSQSQRQRWDIFCRVVDNYGDIGVCWRLARQLASEHDLSGRLWIDNLAVAKRLIPELEVDMAGQTIAGVELRHWREPFADVDVADVVIEAFACDLPPVYLAKMRLLKPIWINLEYLSAESWVADFHLRASPQPSLDLTKTYFFPGFGAQTGSLLRERGLLVCRDAFQNDAEAQQDFWKNMGLQANSSLNISLFCYPTAPITQLLAHLAQGKLTASLLVVEGGLLDIIGGYFGRPFLKAGDSCQRGNLTVHVIPFLSQHDYDRLLWACDINFVRGEDSWIRAIWAGKPMIWQPYVQAEDSHLRKLEAYLELAGAGLPTHARLALHNCYLDWSSPQFPESDWLAYLSHLSTLRQQAQQLAEKFAVEPDLAAKLVIFCKNYL